MPPASPDSAVTARSLSQLSMKYVQAKRKRDWLALWAPDAKIEDPVGESPLDPVGRGHSGIAAIEAFWDQNIAPNTLVFNVQKSHMPLGSNEVCNVGQITTRVNAAHLSTVTDGVFVYRMDPSTKKLVSLRAFYEFDAMLKTSVRFPKEDARL